MPVTFYDPKTGAPAAVAPEEAQKAFSEGKLGPQRDQEVHVVLADGRKGTVPGHELAQNIKNGASLYDPEAEKHAAEVEAENSPLGFAKAAGLSTLEGVTGGLSTGFIRKGIDAFHPTQYDPTTGKHTS